MDKPDRKSPFDLRLILSVLILTGSFVLFYWVIDVDLSLTVILLILVFLSCSVAVLVDLISDNIQRNMKTVIKAFFRYLVYTMGQLLITFSVFPIIPVFFVLGPVLILLFFVSAAACVLLFLVHVVGYMPPWNYSMITSGSG